MRRWIACLLLLNMTAGAVNLPAPRRVAMDELTSSDLPAPLSKNWSNRLVGKYLPSAVTADGLPLPKVVYKSKKKLTLEDAILLALRNNSDVISAQMTRVIDKYNFELAKDKLTPTFSVSDFFVTAQHGAKPSYGAFNPNVSWDTMTGTNVKLDYSHSIGVDAAQGGGSITITQPLLKGVNTNKWTYMTAVDQVKLERMTYYTKILTVVSAVVNGYLSMVQSVMNNNIQQENFKQQKQQYTFAKLRLQAGQISKSDFRQQKSTYISSQLSFSKQKDDLEEQYFTFIQTLGLSLQAKVQIPGKMLAQLSSMTLPLYKVAVKKMLKHNITYLSALLAMYGIQRTVEIDRDSLKWGVSLKLTHDFGKLSTATSADGGSPLGDSAKLSLSIPIDNKDDKIALVQARIKYELAKLALQKTKRTLILNLRKDYDLVTHDKEQLKLSKLSEQVKNEVLQDTQLKYKYGKTTAFELGVVQQDLLTAQQAYVQSQVSYFLDVFKVHQDIGDALAFWHISLRY